MTNKRRKRRAPDGRPGNPRSVGSDERRAEPGARPALPHRPGVLPGSVESILSASEPVCIDPNITEGHAGYEESGHSELILPERFSEQESGETSSTAGSPRRNQGSRRPIPREKRRITMPLAAAKEYAHIGETSG